MDPPQLKIVARLGDTILGNTLVSFPSDSFHKEGFALMKDGAANEVGFRRSTALVASLIDADGDPMTDEALSWTTT